MVHNKTFERSICLFIKNFVLNDNILLLTKKILNKKEFIFLINNLQVVSFTNQEIQLENFQNNFKLFLGFLEPLNIFSS